MQVRILGPIDVFDGEHIVALGGPKERTVLAVLAVNAGLGVSESALIEAVWGGDAPRTAEQTLRSYISRLRRVFDDDDVVIEREGDSYRLVAAAGALDVHEVEKLITASREATATGDFDRASTLLRLAEAMWRGPSLAGFDDQPFAEAEAARLEELRIAVVEERVALDIERGRHVDLTVELEWLTSMHPLRERLWAARMLVLYRTGRQAEALRVYQDLRRRLVDELGIEPSPDVRQLEESILSQTPELDWSAPTAPRRANPLPSTTAGSPTVPPPIEAEAGSPMFGRAQELARLSGLRRAAAGQTRVVVLTGEAGIGKTRLAAVVAAQAGADGAIVLHGRAYEDLVTPYQPVIEAIASHLSTRSEAEQAEIVAHASPELVRLLPGWHDVTPQRARPGSEHAEIERAAFFESVVDVLARFVADEPLVLMLDDLQWAPPSTLLLLGHLLRSARTPSMLVLATVRDTDLAGGHPLSGLLTSLSRERKLDRVPLRGLDEEAIAELAARLVGAELDPRARRLAAAVRHETGGNPFLAGSVVRDLIDSGVLAVSGGRATTTITALDDLELPSLARDVVERLVGRLSDTAQAVLTVAALVEDPLYPPLLEEVVALDDPDAVIDALDEASAAGLLVDEEASYSFTHGLVRRALVARLSTARRARLHRRIGSALERLGADEATLAHHFLEAAPDGQAGKAALHALAAARAAIDRFANEEAVALVERALEVLDDVPGRDPLLRADLWLVLGQASERSNDITRMRDAALRSAEQARAGGSPERMARAIVLLGTQGSVTVGGHDDEFASLCAEISGTLDDSPLRAAVMTQYAGYLSSAMGDTAQARALADEAVRIGRRFDEPNVLADALVKLAEATEDTASLTERRALLSEALELADDRHVEVGARTLLLRLLLESGEFDELDRAIEKLQEIGERRRSWAALANAAGYRAGRALFEGRFDEVEALADQILVHGSDDQDLRNVWVSIITMLFRERGNLVELRPPIVDAMQEQPDIVAFQAAAALVEAYDGNLDEASRLLTVLATDGFGTIPHDPTRSGLLVLCAEVAALIGAAEIAEVLYDVLRPLEGRFVDMAGSGVCLGSADRSLGQLALTCGRAEEAETHLRNALRLEAGVGSRPLSHRSRLWLARALLARGREEDAAEIGALLEAAAAGALELGMAGLAADVEELGRAPLPSTEAPTGFVGRAAQLAELLDAWRLAQDGIGSSVLVSGEPGIGKTQLLTELGRRVRATGGAVLYGRCDEHVGRPYQPFVEALAGLMDLAPVADLTAHLGPRVDELSRLVPEFAAGRTITVADADPAAARDRLFSAVVGLLTEGLRRAPVLLVIDDLQWASTPTALLFSHLVRRSVPGRLLVVGAYRDTDLDGDHPLRDIPSSVAHLELGGLEEAAVSTLVARHDRRSPTDVSELAHALHTATGGNPFFVVELLRHLDDDGDGSGVDGLPVSVRATMLARVARLGDAARRVLDVASVQGLDVSVRILEDVLGVEDDSVLDAIEAATAAGLLVEHGGQYRFRHDLVRRALFEDLSEARRARLHRRIAEALERQPAGTVPVEVLAHHFARAVGDAGPGRAVRYAIAVARQAMDRFAYEEALDHAARAATMLEGAHTGDDVAVRAEALLLLADAQLRCGAFEESRASASQAASDARRLASEELLARAALVYHGMHEFATVDAAFPALCEEALDALGPHDTHWRPALLARLAVYRTFNEGDAAEGWRLAEEAVRLSLSGDADVRIRALDALSLSLQGSTRTADRVAAAEELLALAIREGDVHGQIAGLYHRSCVRLESGDRRGFDTDVERLSQLAETTRSFLGGCHIRAQRVVQAMADARLDDAQEGLNELMSYGLANVNVRFVLGANFVLLHHHLGDLGNLRHLIAAAVEGLAPMPSFRLTLALSLAEADRHERARDELEAACDAQLTSMRRDHIWPFSLAMLVEVCARLDDVERATAAYDELLEWSGKLVAPNGVVCMGAADRYLGVAALTMGEPDRAARHFQDALDVDARAGMKVFEARNRLDWARALLETRRSDEESHAHRLLSETRAQADALGLQGVAAEAAELLGQGVATEEGQARNDQDERRLVTALFADISGFTTLSEQLDDPEELHGIIAPVISGLAAIAERYGGFIAKYAGDALLVFFGAPVTREDDAQRALEVALEMHEALPVLTADLPPEAQGLTLHIGVNTGRVISGQFGGEDNSDYSILGDAVILAQRLESVAPSGETYVGGPTVEMVGDEFALESVGELDLKGKTLPVPAWRLVGRAEAGSGAPAAGPSLVGRRREREQVGDFLDRVTARGVGGVVAVVGEAGVGKSRLLDDTRRAAEGRGLRWLQTRCLSYGDGIAYWPYIELVRTLTGLQGDQRADATRARLRTLVGDEFVPFLATLLGTSAEETSAMPPEAFRRGLLDALAALVEAEAGEGHVVLAIDDVHWSDPSTTAVTADLVQRALPLVVHLTARPEGMPAIDRVIGAARDASLCLDLEPLDRDSVRDLTESLLDGEPPEALVEAVNERTGGNPLFVQEVVRSLVESETLTLVNGHWRLPAGFAPADLPTGIERVLTARIDLLPPSAAGVLRAASVVGREVRLPLLRAVAPEDDRVDAGLRLLLQRGFLDPSADGDPDVVQFHHALVLDAAYGQLLRRHRRELHLRLADAAQQLYGSGDDAVDLLARHLYLGGAGGRAIEALARAGRRARRLYATDEAVSHFDHAVEVARGEHDERLTDLVLELADLRNLLGDYDDALRLYDEAAGGEGRPEAVNGQADVLRKRGDYDAALALLDRSLAEGAAAGSAQLLLQRSWVLSVTGRLADSIDAAERGLALAAGDEAIAAQLRLQLARNETLTGRLDAAGDHAESAREYFARVGDLANEARALRLVGDVHRAAGDMGRAADALRTGIEAAARSGSIEDLGGNLLNLGLVELARGNLDEAIACDERAIREFERIDHGSGQAAGYGNLAEKLLDAGRLQEAEERIERALDKGHAIANALIVADAVRTLARIRLAQDRLDEAAALAADAESRFREIGVDDEADRCAEVAARARRSEA